MQDSTRVNLVVPKSRSLIIRGSQNDVSVEQKGHEQNHEKKVYGGADTTHRLWTALMVNILEA